MSNKGYAVITGGTRGIGLAIAQELMKLGFDPLLNYRTHDDAAQAALSKLSASCPHVRAIRADVTTTAGAELLFSAAEKLGPVAILVNCVGQFLHKPFLSIAPQEWRDIMDSNLTSAVLCCQQVLPRMRERRVGQIINVASMHADRIRSTPHTLPYAIAKLGLIQLTQTLAVTEAPYGIRVNAVCPGFIEGGEFTKAEHSGRVPLGRLGLASEVAKAVRFLVSADANYITGASLNVHGGAFL